MKSVQTLWAEHQATRFPDGLGGAEVRGIDLVTLDADIAACVTSFLGNRGRLDATRRAVLEVCYQNVSSIELELSGEARAYFGRLRQLAQETLRTLKSGAAEA